MSLRRSLTVAAPLTLSRRTFALLPFALSAQAARPGVIWVWFEGDLPAGLRGESIVFPRCYVADARPDMARRASETGKFAHAGAEGDPSLASILKQAGISYREVTLSPGANAVAILEEARNSIVVFTREGILSRQIAEGNTAEKSIRVPLAIVYRGVLKPRAADDILVSQVDLVPTLAALCGVTDLPEVQGRNIAPLLRGEAGEAPDSVFVEGSTWRVVIRGYQKLVTDLTGAPEHLYNIAADPDELNDLARDPASRLTLDGLAALAQLWMRRLGDGLDPSGLKRR
jgi:hypothetical protein